MIREELGELKADMKELREDTNSGFASIADYISGNNDQLANHEQRIGKLEQKTA